MTLEIRWSNVTYTGDQAAVSKLSARKRDELKKVFAEASRVWKAKYVGKTEKYSILRIDNDHLILRGYDVQKWYSEKRKKEYELQRQKEAEEARRAAEAKTAKIYDVVEVEEEPQFPGGPSALSEYLSQNIHYPVVAEENGIQGRVIVTFVVEMDGSVSNVKVVRSVDPALDKEAMRLAKSMPKWTPGKLKGKPVRVKYTMPITFKLQ